MKNIQPSEINIKRVSDTNTISDPEILTAQSEIIEVLKNNGKLKVFGPLIALYNTLSRQMSSSNPGLLNTTNQAIVTIISDLVSRMDLFSRKKMENFIDAMVNIGKAGDVDENVINGWIMQAFSRNGITKIQDNPAVVDIDFKAYDCTKDTRTQIGKLGAGKRTVGGGFQAPMMM